MGLGSISSQGAAKILQQYFTTNVNGAYYQVLYQEFMTTKHPTTIF
jgi:hypothetical protein